MITEAIERGLVGVGSRGFRQPIYFTGAEQPLFAWLHYPAGGAPSRWGVVVCKAFGYEALCAHRSVRAFADAAAALGIPTLRFDYLGTGDSADIDPEADQIHVWTRDIVQAAAELRRRTGIERVCLLGFRLGALLAIGAAGACKADALALVAPVLNGRRYLREARMLQLAAAASEAALSPNDPSSPGSLEVSGYPLSAATVSSLSRMDASTEDLAGISDLLLIDRSDLPLAGAWAEAMRLHGVRTDYCALPGFVQMMMTAPQFAKAPEQMLQTIREWLSRCCTVPSETQVAGRLAQPDGASGTAAQCELALPGQDGSPSAEVTERPVFLSSDDSLFGIVTEPRRDENRRRAVILLNIGADYHIGASRIYVSLARRWARRGYHVLRMDLAGLGDSGTRPARPDNEVFPPGALEDIRAAIDFMCSRYGVRETTLAGLCSGAYHALRAAVAGLPLHRLLMVNAQNYFWDESMSLEGLQLAEVVRNPTIYRERIFSTAAWRRFWSGQVNVWRILSIYVRRPVLTLESLLRELARRLGIHLKHDLARELETLIARGIRVVFVFARGEPGIDLLKIEAGSIIRRLGDRCRVRVVESADHTFSRSAPRQVLEDILSDELFARSQPLRSAVKAEWFHQPEWAEWRARRRHDRRASGERDG